MHEQTGVAFTFLTRLFLSALLHTANRMMRIDQAEILDGPGLADELVERAYRDIASLHRWLGEVRFMVGAIRRDPLPVRRVLDVGCATGLVLQQVSRKLGAEAVGVDIHPRPAIAAPVPIMRADARFDRLPKADVAFCMHLGHHLSEDDLIRVIRNVGRSCRRFILLDLVRHPLPLGLFRVFVTPLICEIDAEDGQRSVRRSYTPEELFRITATALADSAATFRMSVAPFYIRQVVDISYGKSSAEVECESAGTRSVTDAPPLEDAVAEEGQCVR
jgi:SAM-dependent methyltransferase